MSTEHDSRKEGNTAIAQLAVKTSDARLKSLW